MTIQITETAEAINYIVKNREGISDHALANMYYGFENGCYSKSFQKQQFMFTHDLKQMENNYNDFIKSELHPDKRTQENLDASLQWLTEGLKRRKVKWWLAGSGALYVRGLEVKPHDLDVMTYKTGIEAIRRMVSPYIVEPFHHVNGWVVKGFGVVHYRTRIDFAFEPEDWVDDNGPVDFGPHAQSHLEKVVWHGHEILVPPVELHIAPNEARGRHDRVALIKNYMSNNHV